MRILLALAPLLGAVAVTAAEVEPLVPLDDPRPAPAFELSDTAGDTHRLADYTGRTLVVNFWATWCPPCIKEMPALDNLQRELLDDGVVVLGVNMGETVEDIAGFTDRVAVDFPLLLSLDMSAGQAWGVRGLPTTYIVDKQGQIVYEILGEKPWDDPVIVEQIRDLTES
jgi:peroxiredoxin